MLILMLLSFSALALACSAFWRAYRDHYRLQRETTHLERQLQLAQSHLKRRSYLASEIAHDIKNPLTAILCSAEALDMTVGDKLDPVNRRSIHFIREYGEHLLRLLSDFLDINRIQSGHLESHKEEVQVTKIIESVVGLLGAYAERQQVTVSVVVMNKLSAAWIDPAHLKQILFNLVHNAIKFSEADSEVTVILRALEPLPLMSIEVKDLGCGIAADRLDFIFDPYARAPDTKENRESGQGLGLALCQALAELEQCELSVISELGQGTVFTLISPTVPEVVTQSDYPQVLIGAGEISSVGIEAEQQVLAGQRILVVDENEGARESMARLIETWGAIVDSAQEVEQALHALEQCHYDAIVIDDSEGERETEEAAKMLRENLDGQSTRIILSQTRAPQEAAETMKAVDSIVEKPLNGRKILSALLASSIH